MLGISRRTIIRYGQSRLISQDVKGRVIASEVAFALCWATAGFKDCRGRGVADGGTRRLRYTQTNAERRDRIIELAFPTR